MNVALLLVAVALAQAQSDGTKKIGSIDFFGYKGIDIAAVRSALPIHVGDPVNPDKFDRDAVAAAVSKVTGKPPTETPSMVCCDSSGNFTIYIGLAGASYHPLQFDPLPTGVSKLSPALQQAYTGMIAAWADAVMHGNVTEDRSKGYSLLKEPRARDKQLAFRKLVLAGEPAVYDTLAQAADAEQRAIAAAAVGYATRTEAQVAALVGASLDADETVRNNAVRALVVIATAEPEVRKRIPPGAFIDLLRSGSWSDHNKASMLLEALTRSSNQDVLDQLRTQALDSLREMSNWKDKGHAGAARIILGRVSDMH